MIREALEAKWRRVVVSGVGGNAVGAGCQNGRERSQLVAMLLQGGGGVPPPPHSPPPPPRSPSGAELVHEALGKGGQLLKQTSAPPILDVGVGSWVAIASRLAVLGALGRF